MQDFSQLDPEVLRSKYVLGKDAQDWTVQDAQNDVRQSLSRKLIMPITYRPFDTRWTYFTGRSRGFICRPREQVMRHYAGPKNIGLLVPASIRDQEFHHVFVTNQITEVIFLSGTTASNAKNFPLYLYPDVNALDQTRHVNFNSKLYKKLQNLVQHPKYGIPDELAVFDYIYGVLHCPAYRETFKEFLKIDFPRIPWPASPDEFWSVSEKGGQLRRLHLMEPQTVGSAPYPFKGEGDNTVAKPHFQADCVWINKTQYFEGVPEIAWNFYIGGYQPARKWLKDRKGRSLNFDDVKHYQKIIKILSETDRIMKPIEMSLPTQTENQS